MRSIKFVVLLGVSQLTLCGCQQDSGGANASSQSSSSAQNSQSLSDNVVDDTGFELKPAENQMVNFESSLNFESGQWQVQTPNGSLQKGGLSADENYIDVGRLNTLEDGQYQFEVTTTQVVGYETSSDENGREPGLQKPVVIAEKSSGTFVIENGLLRTSGGEGEIE